MKNIIFLSTFILFLSTNLFSQNIEITVGLDWRYERNYLSSNNDSIITPYLVVSYFNNSNESLYCLKPIGGAKIPRFSSNTLHRNPFCYERYNSHYNLDDGFIVDLSCDQIANPMWSVYPDSLEFKLGDEIEEDDINGELAFIYSYLRKKLNIKGKNDELYFKISDTRDLSKLIKTHNSFLILDSHQHVTDYYDLIAFKLLRGTYKFQLIRKTALDYILVESDKENKFSTPDSCLLPEKVNRYNLFKGDFDINELQITF